MRARIVSYEGKRDGIRFGIISFGGLKRRFQLDRLNGIVRLFTMRKDGSPVVTEDADPERLAAAARALGRRR